MVHHDIDAVCGQGGVDLGSEAWGQIHSKGRVADEHEKGLLLFNQVPENRLIGLRVEVFQFRILNEDDSVGPGLQLVGYSSHVVPEKNGHERFARTLGQGPALHKHLIGDVPKFTLPMFSKDIDTLHLRHTPFLPDD